MGATFITIVTVIPLTTEGETQDTRKDLTSLGSQEGVGSHRVIPACPGSQAPVFVRQSPLSCVSWTSLCSRMLSNAGSGVPPVELLVWNLFSPGESEADPVRVTSCPGLPETFQVSALKVLPLRKRLRPWLTRTVGYPAVFLPSFTTSQAGQEGSMLDCAVCGQP